MTDASPVPPALQCSAVARARERGNGGVTASKRRRSDYRATARGDPDLRIRWREDDRHADCHRMCGFEFVVRIVCGNTYIDRGFRASSGGWPIDRGSRESRSIGRLPTAPTPPEEARMREWNLTGRCCINSARRATFEYDETDGGSGQAREQMRGPGLPRQSKDFERSPRRDSGGWTQ